jgi:DnaJ-class molecular chaperone
MSANTLKDFYKILGISKTATLKDVSIAYRDLARKYHPDKNKDKNATGKFQEISEAFDSLSDPAKRAAYDAAQHGRPPSGQPPFAFQHGFAQSEAWGQHRGAFARPAP